MMYRGVKSYQIAHYTVQILNVLIENGRIHLGYKANWKLIPGLEMGCCVSTAHSTSLKTVSHIKRQFEVPTYYGLTPLNTY